MTKSLFTFFIALTCALQAAEPARILIVVGPSEHPPGSHEVAAGGRLLKHCLEATLPGVQADLFNEWPKEKAVRDAARTVIFMGDTFPPQRLPDSQTNLAQLGEMMARGAGIVCLHFATGLRGDDVAADGAHPLLQWMGGYYVTKGVHHHSVARVFDAATITPAAAEHPICRGWREFTLRDEPYTNNYFGQNNNQPASNVTVLATSLLPPEAPKREPVAWCVERTDTGRGFAIVMPHFYKNWANEDLRRFIFNGIVWSAKMDVPIGGVQSAAPDLASFGPGAVEAK